MAHLIPGTPSRGRDLVLGFLAGALAVMTFHQGMVFLLSTVGLIQSRGIHLKRDTFILQ
jgi:hypothetical protein